MANERETCAHSGCGCAKRDDSDYCSTYCEDAQKSEVREIACGCGHDGC
jgi:hypothetical protein